MRFLALGDSYTIGESVAASERWPVQLARLLREQQITIDDPTIIARTGWTTAELSAGIDRAKPQGVYDLVSLLIGVNNQYRGRSEEEYRREFVSLLQRAIGFADQRPARVLVLSIPDWGVTPFAGGRDRAAIGVAIDRDAGEVAFGTSNLALLARRIVAICSWQMSHADRRLPSLRREKSRLGIAGSAPRAVHLQGMRAQASDAVTVTRLN